MIIKTLLLNDALKILYKEYPNVKVSKVIYYDRWFVFDMEPSNETDDSMIIKSLIAVDKISGEVIGFNPLIYDIPKFLVALSKAVSI
jgi:hypothetical protein